MNKRLLAMAMAVVGVMGFHAVAGAQDTTTTTTTTTVKQGDQGTTVTTYETTLTYHLRRDPNPIGGGDRVFLMHAYHDNVFEIEAARVALAKTKNHDVWKYAEKVFNDHMAMNNDLRTTWANGPWMGWNAMVMEGEDGKYTPMNSSMGDEKMNGNKVAWDTSWEGAREAKAWLSKDEMGRLDELKSFNGYSFDREFLSCMTKDHANALHMFAETKASTTNPTLKSYIESKEDMVANHLSEARSLQFLRSDPFHVQRTWPWWN